MIDFKYTYGGPDLVNGDYEIDETVGSAYERLQACHRGKWIGGRGIVVGSRLHGREYIEGNMSPVVEADVHEAEAPLLLGGYITESKVTVDVSEPEKVSYVAEYVDRTTGDGIKAKVG